MRADLSFTIPKSKQKNSIQFRICSASLPSPVMEALEKPFTEAITAGQIEGAILEARSKTGKTYSKAFGNRTLQDGTQKPQSSSDLLFLASSTKLLTAIAVLQCCEKGLLSLDEDLRSSYFGHHKVLTSYEDGGEPTYEELKKPLTLRHLLTHSSGLAYDFMSPLVQRWLAANPVPDAKETSLSVPTRYHQPLVFQPGESWVYGVGLDWAGHIVEQVSNTKLDAYIRSHILKPLDIAETELSFFPIKEGLGHRMVDLNPKDPLGEGLSVGNGLKVHIENDSTCYGGQGAYATGETYVKILHSLLVDDGKLLSKESVAEMTSPQLEAPTKAALDVVLNGPLGMIAGMGTTTANRDYGLSGLLVMEEGDGSGMGKGALAWGGGINSAWNLDPERGVCGFVAPQLGLPADVMKAKQLKDAFRLGVKGALDDGA